MRIKKSAPHIELTLRAINPIYTQYFKCRILALSPELQTYTSNCLLEVSSSMFQRSPKTNSYVLPLGFLTEVNSIVIQPSSLKLKT